MYQPIHHIIVLRNKSEIVVKQHVKTMWACNDVHFLWVDAVAAAEWCNFLDLEHADIITVMVIGCTWWLSKFKVSANLPPRPFSQQSCRGNHVLLSLKQRASSTRALNCDRSVAAKLIRRHGIASHSHFIAGSRLPTTSPLSCRQTKNERRMRMLLMLRATVIGWCVLMTLQRVGWRSWLIRIPLLWIEGRRKQPWPEKQLCFNEGIAIWWASSCKCWLRFWLCSH